MPRQVHALGDGTCIFVECIDGGERRQFLQRISKFDPRILYQDLDALGKPECFKEIRSKSDEYNVA